jgi:hypothetical protein
MIHDAWDALIEARSPTREVMMSIPKVASWARYVVAMLCVSFIAGCRVDPDGLDEFIHSIEQRAYGMRGSTGTVNGLLGEPLHNWVVVIVPSGGTSKTSGPHRNYPTR